MEKETTPVTACKGLPRQVMAGVLVLMAGLSANPAIAQSCAARYPLPESTARMFDVALALEDALNDLGQDHQVVLLARGGQDLTRYGLRHSHLAFALREESGTWRVVHLLNRCKSGESRLYREGLANFIGESAQHADVRVGVFRPSLQRRLHEFLASSDVPKKLHEPRYSMVAYPFSTEYQNSNQWVLEVLAAAGSPDTNQASSRVQAQARLKQQGYKASRLHLKLHERLGARFGIDHVAVEDHPAGERISGNYSVVTVESVFDFLHQQNLLLQDYEVSQRTRNTIKESSP